MPKLTLKQLEQKRDEFNAKYKVGQWVDFNADSGKVENAEIYHEATIMGGHTVMTWLKGYASYSVDKVIGLSEKN